MYMSGSDLKSIEEEQANTVMSYIYRQQYDRAKSFTKDLLFSLPLSTDNLTTLSGEPSNLYILTVI